MPQRNRPIAKLIKWFVNREKGKVVDARHEIQWRFRSLDWNDQKKILFAFLSSGKEDRKWAYKQLVNYWDDSFFPKVKEIWETFHEYELIRPAIECFPKEYLREHKEEFCNAHYYAYCRRFVNDPDFEIDQTKVSPKGYMLLMRHGKRPFSEKEAKTLIYKQIYLLCCLPPNTIIEKGLLCRGINIEEEDFPTAMEFRDIYAMVKTLEEYEMIDLSQSFYQWAGDAYMNFIHSKSYDSLIAEKVSHHLLYDKKIFLAKKMMYEAIPEQYKTDDGEWTISHYDRQPLSQFDSFRSYIEHYRTSYRIIDENDFPQEEKKEEMQTASPKQIREMMDKNPAIATLIEKLGIDVEDDNDCPF